MTRAAPRRLLVPQRKQTFKIRPRKSDTETGEQSVVVGKQAADLQFLG
jgi:hypothetical protein